jgi:hypothetical protein
MLASPSYYILSILSWYTPQVEQITHQMGHLTTLNMSLVCCMVHFDTSCLPDFTDTNHGCWCVCSYSAAQDTLGRFQRVYGKLHKISILNPCHSVPNNILGINCRENTNQILRNGGQWFNLALRRPNLFILRNQSDEALETEVCPMKLMDHWHLTSHLVFLDSQCVHLYQQATSSVKRSDTIFGDWDEQG